MARVLLCQCWRRGLSRVQILSLLSVICGASSVNPGLQSSFPQRPRCSSSRDFLQPASAVFASVNPVPPSPSLSHPHHILSAKQLQDSCVADPLMPCAHSLLNHFVFAEFLSNPPHLIQRLKPNAERSEYYTIYFLVCRLVMRQVRLGILLAG